MSGTVSLIVFPRGSSINYFAFVIYIIIDWASGIVRVCRRRKWTPFPFSFFWGGWGAFFFKGFFETTKLTSRICGRTRYSSFDYPSIVPTIVWRNKWPLVWPSNILRFAKKGGMRKGFYFGPAIALRNFLFLFWPLNCQNLLYLPQNSLRLELTYAWRPLLWIIWLKYIHFYSRASSAN